MFGVISSEIGPLALVLATLYVCDVLWDAVRIPSYTCPKLLRLRTTTTTITGATSTTCLHYYSTIRVPLGRRSRNGGNSHSDPILWVRWGSSHAEGSRAFGPIHQIAFQA